MIPESRSWPTPWSNSSVPCFSKHSHPRSRRHLLWLGAPCSCRGEVVTDCMATKTKMFPSLTFREKSCQPCHREQAEQASPETLRRPHPSSQGLARPGCEATQELRPKEGDLHSTILQLRINGAWIRTQGCCDSRA